MIKFSVVIPVYDSDRSLEELYIRTKKVFGELGETFEIIFVDDCSPNSKTWPILEGLCEKFKEVKAIQLRRNFGKAGAMMCGFQDVSGNYVITMDDDLQHLPEEIPKLIEKKEHDIVIMGYKEKQHSFLKKFTSNIKSWFDNKILGKPRHILNSPFKLIKRDVIESVKKIKTPYPFISGLLFFVTKDIEMVYGTHGNRKYGRSQFNFYRRLKQFSNLLINNSSFLLRMIAYAGIMMSCLSFLFGTFLILNKLFWGGAQVSGWTSLMVVTLILGGLLLLSVGIVGEYLIRIIENIEHKPAFVVRKKIAYGRKQNA